MSDTHLKHLNISISKDLDLKLEDIVGKSIAVIGITGSGKTNTVAVILEELLEHGMPLAVVDVEGEYWGLKEKYEVLVVGKSENADIEVSPDDAAVIAEVSLSRNVPVILDISGFLSEEQYRFLINFFTRLWNLSGKLRKPYIVAIEEAQEFIPQGVRTDLKELLTLIARRGRKRGLSVIMASQRTTLIDKNALTQTAIRFLHHVNFENDLNIYYDLIPLPRKEVKQTILSLKPGDCILVRGSEARRVHIRLRKTFHAGYTPTLEPVKTPELKKVSDEILEAIKRAKKSGKSEAERLQEKVKELEAKLAEREKKINELESILKTLSYLKFPAKMDVEKLVVRSAELPVQQSSGVMLEQSSGVTSEQITERPSAESTPEGNRAEKRVTTTDFEELPNP